MKNICKQVFSEAMPNFRIEFITETKKNNFLIIAKGQHVKANFTATYNDKDGWFIDAINQFEV